MNRSTRRRSMVMLSILALVPGCVDSNGILPIMVNQLPSLIVSSPESPSAGMHAAGSRRGTVSAAGVVGTAWASLPPGSVPTGQSATLQNGRSGASLTVVIVDGGFDPVAITAIAGDTVLVEVTTSSGNTPLIGFQVVAAKTAPKVVRTSPAPGKKDVPLNASIVVVFSAPIDTATLSSGSFGLLRGGTSVGGTVRPIGPNAVSAEFYPDSVLAPLTSYQLVVTPAIRDVNGVPLAAAATSTFTTAASASTTGNLQLTISGLPVTGLGAVTVSGPGGYSQTVTTSTTLSALVPGTYTIAALNVFASNATYGPALASQAVSVTASEAEATAIVSYAVLPSGWATMAPMLTARQLLAVDAVNGVLYAVGGSGAAGGSASTVEAYEPTTNTWTSRASMPTARAGLAVGVVNGVLYAVGGMDPVGNPLSNVEAYDPATNTWAAKAPMPTARYLLTVGVVNGVLYAVGGENATNNLTTVEAYDPATNTWTATAAMPTGRSWLAGGVVNGILYAVGGFGGVGSQRQPLSTVEAYDPATNSWTTKAALSAARYGLAAGVVDGALYVVGGDSPYPAGTVEAYDPTTNTWTTRAPMPTARSRLAAGVFNGILYSVGGSPGNNGSNIVLAAAVEAYTP